MQGDLETLGDRYVDNPEKRVIQIHFEAPTIGIRALRKIVLAMSEERQERVHASGVRSTNDGRYFLRIATLTSEVGVWETTRAYTELLDEHGVGQVSTVIGIPPSLRAKLVEEKFIDE